MANGMITLIDRTIKYKQTLRARNSIGLSQPHIQFLLFSRVLDRHYLVEAEPTPAQCRICLITGAANWGWREDRLAKGM